MNEPEFKKGEKVLVKDYDIEPEWHEVVFLCEYKGQYVCDIRGDVYSWDKIRKLDSPEYRPFTPDEMKDLVGRYLNERKGTLWLRSIMELLSYWAYVTKRGREKSYWSTSHFPTVRRAALKYD